MILLSTSALAAAASAWKWRHHQSVAVQRWSPSSLPSKRCGSLHVRSGGTDGPVIVLLHGLVASGDIFGAGFDTLTDSHTLVVPDLLGFGRSLDDSRDSFTVDDHLNALDETLELLGLANKQLVIGAHSMGAALALPWAARLGPRVQTVVSWGAPSYPDTIAIDSALASSGLMAKAFAGSNRTARAACHLNCRHRTSMGWVAAAASPSLPVAIARMASLHTWPAYRDAIELVIGTSKWADLASTVASNHTSIQMTWGMNDSIGDPEFARSLTDMTVQLVPGADHHLPLTHPDLCVEQLHRAAGRS